MIVYVQFTQINENQCLTTVQLCENSMSFCKLSIKESSAGLTATSVHCMEIGVLPAMQGKSYYLATELPTLVI